jgi:serine/threonine-protein kinase RsbW
VFSARLQFRVEIAVREAVANAVIHGNREDPRKRVYVVCGCTLEGHLLLSIGDEGSGFDVGGIADPTAPENLLLTHGRGLRLMRTFMDEVRFENGGAVVRLIKRLPG